MKLVNFPAVAFMQTDQTHKTYCGYSPKLFLGEAYNFPSRTKESKLKTEYDKSVKTEPRTSQRYMQQ